MFLKRLFAKAQNEVIFIWLSVASMCNILVIIFLLINLKQSHITINTLLSTLSLVQRVYFGYIFLVYSALLLFFPISIYTVINN